MFVRDSACRGAYQMLFQNRQAVKIYECLAPCRPISGPRFGTIMQVEPPRPFPLLRRSHITKEHGTMAAFEEPGLANAETLIEARRPLFPSRLAGGGREARRVVPSREITPSAATHSTRAPAKPTNCAST